MKTVFYTKAQPLEAPLNKRELLTTEGSTRSTWHLELSVAESGWHHEPGDAVGILPRNDPWLVARSLQALGLEHDAPVVDRKSGETFPAIHALTHHLAIHKASRRVLQLIHEHAPQRHPDLATLLHPDHGHHLEPYLEGRALFDLLETFPSEVNPADLLQTLPRLMPRFYSIANSLLADPHHVHLTVADVSFFAHGHERHGVCSRFLVQGCTMQDTLPMFLFPTRHFRLPAEDHRPLIMIGPGTGLAPFRAFLQHRQALGSASRNWLFFGERNSETDFYYREELLGYERSGLCRLTLAWSRDQAHKVYVQHKLLEYGAEVWGWIQDGAIIYVCGDASVMAKDVQAAFLALAHTQGGMTSEEASSWLRHLKSSHRYLEDVY